jgi:ATP-dependent helicase/nuclease subunit A
MYDEKSDGGAPCSLFMSENFRCSKNVIDFTNGVCSYLFRESEKGVSDAGIGYLPQDDLRFSRGAGGDMPVCIAVAESEKFVNNESEDGEGDGETHSAGLADEINFVVSEIKHLVAHGYLPDGKKIRPCDIAVLARSNSTCSKMAEALAHEGVRYANSVGSGLFENPEVLLMLSLLSACDNPRRDLALAGALRSPIFNFSLSDLVKIRLGRKDTSLYDAMLEYAADNPDGELTARCLAASQRLEGYRLSAESMPVHRFIKYLWRDCAVLTYAGSSPESRKRTPAERRKNLQQLYEYARKYEASAYKSLHDFVDYVYGIIENDTEVKTEDISDENTVNIMSVHKSKGLEFPIVFFINTASNMSRRDCAPPILFTTDDDIGLTAKLGDKTGLGTFDTPIRLAAAEKIDARGIDEAIRILYVALTRARDMLYITASGGKDFLDTMRAAAKRRAALGGRTALTEKRSLFAWIMLALEAGRGLGSYDFKQIKLGYEEEDTPEDELAPVIDGEKIEPMRAELCRRLAYAYPHTAISQIPAKLSVSRLYPEALDQTDDTAELLRKVEESEPRTPRFMGGGNDAAERGTATHLFMQFCDFSRLDGSEESVRREADRLLTEGFIPQSAADIIRINEVAAFSRSALMSELLAAQKLYREQRFNVFLDAKDFTSSPEFSQEIDGERLLVQGVIDLFFIDAQGKLVLCDYKTDRLTREELKDGELARKTLTERHGEQLGYYSLALERIMGRRPDRVCIFSLHAGCAFDVI